MSVSWTEGQVAAHEAKMRATSEGDQELARDANAVPDGEEESLHYEIIRYCQQRGWLYLHGSLAHKTKRTEGEPDFTVIADGGRVFFVECKTRTGTLSDKQKNFKARAEMLGTKVHVVRSLADFVVLTNQKCAESPNAELTHGPHHER